MAKRRTRTQWLAQCEQALKRAGEENRDYVEIPLTQGKVTKIDIEDYGQVKSAGPWCAVWDSNTNSFYAIRNVKTGEGRTSQQLHRFIVQPPDDMHIDHENHDTLDNCRSNLREATKSQNLGNQRVRKGTASQYKGVTWHKHSGKWRARINCDGKQEHLGYYNTEEKAALAYNKRAVELFGEFAELNTVKESNGRV